MDVPTTELRNHHHHHNQHHHHHLKTNVGNIIIIIIIIITINISTNIITDININTLGRTQQHMCYGKMTMMMMMYVRLEVL